jgi:hypothetical protein
VSDRTRRKLYAVAVDRALRLSQVEGCVWQSGLGSLAYAYPTYEGSGQKTDRLQASVRHGFQK